MVHSLVHNYLNAHDIPALPTDNKKPAKLNVYAGLFANLGAYWLM